MSTRGQTLTLYGATLDLVTENCCACGVVFAMPSHLRAKRIQDRQSFYCPNGHGQSYTGKTDAEKLREAQAQLTHLKDQHEARVRSLREQRDAAERSQAALRGVVTRTKKRVANGVCPCCNRSFENLARHMGAKHPDYAPEATK